jgi:hypothetical protein
MHSAHRQPLAAIRHIVADTATRSEFRSGFFFARVAPRSLRAGAERPPKRRDRSAGGLSLISTRRS